MSKTHTHNYRVIIEQDERSGTDEPAYTAYVPALGIATDGDSIEDALRQVQDAVSTYVAAAVEDGMELPKEASAHFMVTSATVKY